MPSTVCQRGPTGAYVLHVGQVVLVVVFGALAAERRILPDGPHHVRQADEDVVDEPVTRTAVPRTEQLGPPPLLRRRAEHRGERGQAVDRVGDVPPPGRGV